MTNNYYQKLKERHRKEARERHHYLSEEKKDKKQKKTRERYQNLTEEKKEKRIFLRNKSKSQCSIEKIII